MKVCLSRLKAWFKWSLSDLFFRWVQRHAADKSARYPGVNLVGYAHAEMGLGEALRNTARALEDVQMPFLVRKLDVPLLNRQDNRALDPYVVDYCTYGVNLIGINPDLMYRIPVWLSYNEWARRYNIGYWFWELANFPAPWRYACRMVDEVWVNTDFVADAVRQVHDRVVKMPFAVAFDTPAPIYDRRYYGLPEGGTHFLFSYDLNSSTARKNPGDVIRAFHQAFPAGDEPVVLVVKLINGEQSPAALDALNQSLQHDHRICLIDRYLTTDEMRGLLNTADCYVSLHRAEGLGLGMAESMFQGKPVIATAYSGNMEFMNSENSCLVPYKLIPVASGEYPYHQGQKWAEPDIYAAAAWMARLVKEPDLRMTIGQRAAAYMRKHHARDVMGRAIQARLVEIDAEFCKRNEKSTKKSIAHLEESDRD
jgi:glycosyltransferase involved in cell wall biosynthesis